MSTAPSETVAPLQELRDAVRAAAAALRGSAGEPSPHPKLERPKRAGQGDYATNAAMLLAPALRAPPAKIASILAEELRRQLGDSLQRTDVAGPGFLNLFLSDAWHRRALAAVLASGDRFGTGLDGPAERILIEFVSANPTGPLVAAGGRHAAYGDSLARILAHQGHSVSREYYFNDAGSQVRLLGESVKARARGEPLPDGGYQGEYVAELAASIPDAASAPVDAVAGRAVELLLAQIKATLERYGVHYDTFFSERQLHTGSPSPLERALEMLQGAGYLYRSEGALWLRTTTFGDDKDRVVVRSNGEPTYFAADLAYMLNKRERGFDRLLYPLGADHLVYVRELKAAMAALGGEPDTIEAPILQFVHLIEGGERAAMSKRTATFVTLDELLDEIGVDATRFFMLQRSHDRTLDLDLDLARRESAENPVYYVQYAHARVASMLERVPDERLADAALVSGAEGGSGQLHEPERALIQKLVEFPDEVAEAGSRRGPHRIAAYSLELAQEFTTFYRDCRVIGSTPAGVESFRIALSAAAGRVIALSLGLLGVTAPEAM
jgi:arginyl-tRNA synthetase